MSSRLLQPASEISTHFRCDNCGLLLNKVSWMQCKICKAFDLCDDCAKTEYGELPPETRINHQKLHSNAPVNNDCMKLILVEEAEIGGNQARLKRRQKEYEHILEENKIQNDYEMSVVMDKLKQTALESSSSSSTPSQDNQVNSIIVRYYLKATQRNIRVLSLDGGG